MIPYGLGGGADLFARVIIKIMTDEKLVPVNVTAVNKPGGGASVGVAYVLTTKNADPNTLVLFNPQTQITPLTVKDARGWRDLTPIAPLVLGLVLEPMLETTLRQSMTLSHGSLAIFVTRPIAATLIVLTLVIVAAPLFMRFFRRGTLVSQ